MSEFIEVPAVEGATSGEAEGELLIVADLAPIFTCASHQNSISVLRSIRVENATDKSLDDLRLELTASPRSCGRKPGSSTTASRSVCRSANRRVPITVEASAKFRLPSWRISPLRTPTPSRRIRRWSTPGCCRSRD